jgi:hypothetical protein
VIELDPDCIQMTALIPRPGGYDLRFLNTSDSRSEAQVRIQPEPADMRVVTLGGVLGERLVAKGGIARIPLRPWEIVTLRVLR